MNSTTVNVFGLTYQTVIFLIGVSVGMSLATVALYVIFRRIAPAKITNTIAGIVMLVAVASLATSGPLWKSHPWMNAFTIVILLLPTPIIFSDIRDERRRASTKYADEQVVPDSRSQRRRATSRP